MRIQRGVSLEGIRTTDNYQLPPFTGLLVVLMQPTQVIVCTCSKVAAEVTNNSSETKYRPALCQHLPGYNVGHNCNSCLLHLVRMAHLTCNNWTVTCRLRILVAQVQSHRGPSKIHGAQTSTGDGTNFSPDTSVSFHYLQFHQYSRLQYHVTLPYPELMLLSFSVLSAWD